MNLPLVEMLPYQDPHLIFSHLNHLPGCVLLESAQLRQDSGRYSYIAVDPFEVFAAKGSKGPNPFDALREFLKSYPLDTVAGLPPFQGGMAGYLGYELAQHLEVLPSAASDPLGFEDLMLGLYDVVIAFDGLERRAWIFSSGYPHQEAAAREQRAWQRLGDFKTLLNQLPQGAQAPAQPEPVTARDLVATCDAPAYEAKVAKVIDYILAGDIFEANFTQAFRTPLNQQSPFALYSKLRELNPAPFAAYLHFGNTQLISASPERYLSLEDQRIEARPIKGTRPRGSTLKNDHLLAAELLASEKDRAENIMIVDLLRNDLSRVCEDHSVEVEQLCGLETYANVHHLVSVITGKLEDHFDAVDLLKATFPGGSITGAPKIRAMEIIAELEPTQRGPYCGAILWLGFNGNLDSSITIRTLCIKDGQISFAAGGAIVADSKPHEEYQEMLTKAQMMKFALGV